jgi:hypothetical protein
MRRILMILSVLSLVVQWLTVAVNVPVTTTLWETRHQDALNRLLATFTKWFFRHILYVRLRWR